MSNSMNKKRPGRPKLTDNTNTKNQILHTASQLFMTYGYENVSMEQVAESSQVTKASVYYYFNNKATLFTTAVSNMFNRVKKHTEQLLESHKGLKQRLYEVTVDHLKRPHVDFETLLKEASPSLSEDNIHVIRTAESGVNDALEAIFKQAVENEEISTTNPLLLAHAFSTVTMIRNKKALIEELGGAEKTASALVELFWNGIEPR
ncbi:TetR/AcrR family transcriptional regulator [Sutcliffiella horikoshii]|nr:TetR/AcrR family transcriptional regulator [Sutcliffiella horikoshii]